MLDYFALIVLLVLLVSVVAAIIMLGMAPGRIAKSRNHPQAEAVNVCGWWGVITLGVLLPLAFVWAYYIPQNESHPRESENLDVEGPK